ncbi:MAG TPA: PP2C family protein-serine/threonine phosphatase [Acidimicrobiales bacterium]|jgi:serine phosphatase RsbU (regulator of sigma subunit)
MSLTRTIEVALVVVAAGCGVSAVVWGRSSRRLQRAWRRLGAEVEKQGRGADARDLARSQFRKEVHTAGLYLAVGAASLGLAIWDPKPGTLFLVAVLVPVGVSFRYGPRFLAEARMAEQRAALERRAEEVLAQEELAPLRWAARLAPPDLPPIDGFEVGRVYEPGTGMMAGDFYDVYQTAESRTAVVIGDVTGHGIEPSITAFQIKYLLRVFLREYRDPAQALEELNAVMSAQGRPEEFVSLVAAVFDTAAGTLRYASAGHPPGWMWTDGEVRALRATGPLLTLDPHATYISREIELSPGDLLLLYTDGLAEARAGESLFGEERIAGVLRRDPGQDARVLCKSLLDAAQDFADGALTDDVAILAIRRV